MSQRRRSFLKTAALVTSGLCCRCPAIGQETETTLRHAVIGQPEATEVGLAILERGGNAVDAVVAGALAAGVVALPSTGIGGYGGVAIVGGLPDGRIRALDFNTTAPAALREDQFVALGAAGQQAHATGWTSVGVPGVLAGLQKLLDLFGSQTFSQLAEPAIRYARDGFKLPTALAATIARNQAAFRLDPGASQLMLPGGQVPEAGRPFRNPDLADLLETLANAGRVDEFYHGRYAAIMAQQSQQHGGLLTVADFASYRAREVEPLQMSWGDYSVYTPPPTSGGLTVLQTLHCLKELQWPLAFEPAQRDFALVEAMRLAWHDRLETLGDPCFRYVPKVELLSRQYAEQSAASVRQAVASGRPLSGRSDGRQQGGTIHLSAVDAQGLSVALTFTHGDGFGAKVAADGLGLMLGHGLSRFDLQAGRANSPGSSKRPLHNMCPTLVTKGDRIAYTLGAVGGRRIVNAVTHVLSSLVATERPLLQAVQASRVHTEGSLEVMLESEHPARSQLTNLGYLVREGKVANLNAIERTETGSIGTARN